MAVVNIIIIMFAGKPKHVFKEDFHFDRPL